LVVWQGLEGNVGPSVVGWAGALSDVQVLGVLAAVLLAAQWWFLFRLLRQNGRLARRLEAVEERLANGGLALTSSENGAQEAVTLESLRSLGKPILLVFTEPGCGYCEELLPEVRRWQEELADEFTIAVITSDDPEENRAMSNEHGLSRVLLEEDWEVSEAYDVDGTPSAVLVNPDGTIGSSLAEEAEEIEELVSQAAKGSKERPEPR
jgi:thiol-disulfide isomerase/thioredoxin